MENKIKPDTLLHKIPDLKIRITGNTDIELSCFGQIFQGNQYTLLILHVFSTSKPLNQGLEELKPFIKSQMAWIELTSHIFSLFEHGILTKDISNSLQLKSDNGKFYASDVHIRMLNDVKRTKSYQEAIQELVNREKVVVEIGTGTGILTASAALAGAKHVYSIERNSNMAKIAGEVFKENSISKQISVIEGDSTNIEIPEKADILISEIIGNDPLGEGILSTTMDAVKRFLKPHGVLIPSAIRIMALPVEIPENIMNKHVFSFEAISNWREWYGVDFSSFLDISQKQNHHTLINTYKTKDWIFLTDPIILKEIDLKNIQENFIKSRINAQIKSTGKLNGILVYFTAQLSPSVTLSIQPDEATPENSWSSLLWIAGKPLNVKEGNVLNLNYTFTPDSGSEFEINLNSSLQYNN